MRNLKKILALVLALVMSLSLMATASATDFKDDDQFTETYKVAAQVLEGLGVLKGDPDGSFRPTGSITRAEAAAAVYRIVTGDVEDKQVGIYGDYQIFSDVNPGDWYAGYVNFCANAEYIKGNGDGTFSPNEKVSGYAVLAMILRAIGYTANGGFTGDEWHIQTARTAESRKITKNILTGMLGEDATRETVAELLFQAIMVKMVNHDQDNTFNGNQGYFEINETLGHKIFGLEYITGVILANEWANLEDDTVLADNTTRMKVTGASEIGESAIEIGQKITLSTETDLDSVGMTYTAYVSNKSGARKVLTLDPDGNTVAFNQGKAVGTGNRNQVQSSILNLAKTEGITSLAGAEYYVDYEQTWTKDCDSEYRIAYAISKEYVDANVDLWEDYMAALAATGATETLYVDAKAADSIWNGYSLVGHYYGIRNIQVNWDVDGDGDVDTDDKLPCYYVAIRPECTINEIDQAIMQEVFYAADRLGGNNVTSAGVTSTELRNYALGEVYAGTTSMRDYSDEISWNEYKAKFFNPTTEADTYDSAKMGESLRVIDNNSDGTAEYVLKITYTQDLIVGNYKDAPLMKSGLKMSDYEGNYLYSPNADDLAAGVVVNWNIIDEKLSVWTAEVVEDSINNKNFDKWTVTTVESGETYDQSGINNRTGMDEIIMNMAQRTPYVMYLDRFQNIRSYKLAQDTKYALLTEMYPTGSQQGNYVTSPVVWAEMKIADGEKEEHIVNPNSVNPFLSYYIWTYGWNNYFTSAVYTNTVDYRTSNPNYLQPAIAHLTNSRTNVTGLALGARGVTNNKPSYLPYAGGWYRAVSQLEVTDNAAEYTPVFDYGPYTGTISNLEGAGNSAAAGTASADHKWGNTNHSFSFTNVAAYTMSDDNVNLGTVSKLAAKNGAQIYRVSTAAAAAAGLPTTLYEGKTGTKAELIDLYNKGKSTSLAPVTNGETAWWDVYVALTDGTGIYPVYEIDYVQLDLSKNSIGTPLAATETVVTSNTRHYWIDDSYNTKYNTLSNSYVDATVDTEFYIVMPDDILYRVGIADLPTILAGEVRAAYAVATNTGLDNNTRDYWVADVIVIEVASLAHNFDSVSLIYNNPYENTGYTQALNSLNNQWFALQPDKDARLNVIPERVQSAAGWTGWANVAWSNNTASLGFYKLYQTAMTDNGDLDAYSVQKITAPGTVDANGDPFGTCDGYNKYGIYAGEVSRTAQGLIKTNYLDVTADKTGEAGNPRSITIKYSDYEVPVYRIYTAYPGPNGDVFGIKRLDISEITSVSDLRPGDDIIWVYNQAKNRVAFIVSVDKHATLTDPNPEKIPAWLTTLYGEISAETNYKPVTGYTVSYEFYTDVTDEDTQVTPAGITATPTAIPAANKDSATKLATTVAAASTYTIDTSVDPVVTGATLMDDGTDLYIANVTGNVTVKYQVAPKTYAVKLDDTAAVAGDTVALADKDGTAITTAAKTTAGSPIAYGEDVTLTITAAAATTGYEVTVNDEPVSEDATASTSTSHVYVIPVRGETNIVVTGTAAAISDVGAVTALTFSDKAPTTQPANLADGNSNTVNTFPVATTETKLAVTSTGASVKVWQGVPAANIAVSPDADGKYPMSVGTTAAPRTYTIQVFSAAGTLKSTVTVILSATAPSNSVVIKPIATATFVEVKGATDWEVNILNTMNGITYEQLRGYLEANSATTPVTISFQTSAGAAITDESAPVAAGAKVHVVAQDGTTNQDYTITFKASF